jgi:hypothetical protein
MVSATVPQGLDLERMVLESTGRRIRDLSIDVRPGRVVLRGQANSYHVKQLAQHGLCNALPRTVRVENAIVVTKS